MAGVGSGIYTAVAVATLGASSHPARAYNIMLFLFAFSQAAEMYVVITSYSIHYTKLYDLAARPRTVRGQAMQRRDRKRFGTDHA